LNQLLNAGARVSFIRRNLEFPPATPKRRLDSLNIDLLYQHQLPTVWSASTAWKPSRTYL